MTSRVSARGIIDLDGPCLIYMYFPQEWLIQTTTETWKAGKGAGEDSLLLWRCDSQWAEQAIHPVQRWVPTSTPREQRLLVLLATPRTPSATSTHADNNTVYDGDIEDASERHQARIARRRRRVLERGLAQMISAEQQPQAIPMGEPENFFQRPEKMKIRRTLV